MQDSAWIRLLGFTLPAFLNIHAPSAVRLLAPPPALTGDAAVAHGQLLVMGVGQDGPGRAQFFMPRFAKRVLPGPPVLRPTPCLWHRGPKFPVLPRARREFGSLAHWADLFSKIWWSHYLVSESVICALNLHPSCFASLWSTAGGEFSRPACWKRPG
ncbi:MAG: hypothetical protein M2R45_04590 [Verrucomicrobia subdivision 3 bacterium]|nr:hypothetical protein [Limisphaerales bacterium]MCS1417365.1 hypothetical protein [Limisphaerales bacterium]